MKSIQNLLKVYLLWIAALMPILCVSDVFGATIRVPSEKPTIQAGIDAASNGDTVIVADGTYKGDGNNNIDFKGKAITVRSENGAANCIINCEGKERGFYFHSKEKENSVLSGFTVTNGNVDDNGGGMYFKYSSPTITDCIITANILPKDRKGGGIYCYESSPSIKNCIISKNSADSGGGMYFDYSPANITDCIVERNRAAYDGAGIYGYYSSATILNSVISNNEVEYGSGGGIYFMKNSKPVISNCTISKNIAKSGAGIHIHDCNSSILSCIIKNNKAQYWGGGIYCSGKRTYPKIANCAVIENEARGAGIDIDQGVYSTIVNCTIRKKHRCGCFML